MAGHSRLKNGVASLLAADPAIPIRMAPNVPKQDAGVKPAHDEKGKV
jgi:hypothetical protein